MTEFWEWDPRKQMWVYKLLYDQYSYYWDWASCRAGNWIHQNHGFVLVLHKPPKKHHHPPIVWVHAGDKTGFVPRSPLDKTGKPPVNLKYGLFLPTGEAGPTGEVGAGEVFGLRNSLGGRSQTI